MCFNVEPQCYNDLDKGNQNAFELFCGNSQIISFYVHQLGDRTRFLDSSARLLQLKRSTAGLEWLVTQQLDLKRAKNYSNVLIQITVAGPG